MFKVRFKAIKDSLIRDLTKDISLVLKWGMFKSEVSAKRDYLSGPRPEFLGVVTGRLRNSIKSRVFASGGKVVGELGTNVSYARAHELGLGNMPLRPFLRPAIEDNLEKIKDKLEEHIFNSWNKK